MQKKRKLRWWVKAILVLIPLIAGITCLIIFAFKLKDIDYTSDIGQFTKEEVRVNLDRNKVDNAFIFWFNNLIGQSTELDLFEDYKVSLKSFSKVAITGHEKKFKGYVNESKMNSYFDNKGKVLKIVEDKIKKTPKVTGLKITGINLCEKLKTDDSKKFDVVLEVANGVGEYDLNVKRIHINKDMEVSLFIKNVRVDLGRTTNLNKKLKDLNDMSKNIKHFKGILNMKEVNNEGKYILKKSKNIDINN